MKTSNLKKQRQHGFSLVELLTVISVIGIIAGIALPSMGNVNTAASKAVNQRNAQNIVSIFQSGVSAGLTWTGGAVRNTLIGSVVSGQSPASGAFTGQSFKLPSLTGTDLTGAYPYVGIDASNNLYYDKAGGQSAT